MDRLLLTVIINDSKYCEGDYIIGIFLTFDDASLFTYIKCSLLMFILIHSFHIVQSHVQYML